MTFADPHLEALRRRIRARVDDCREETFPVLADRELLVDLLVSKIILTGLHADSDVEQWLGERMRRTQLHSRTVPLASLAHWAVDESTGNFAHESGRFFTILGLHVRHRRPQGELIWDQPIIDQPEIGILGILAQRFNGVLHFCLQAKEEPGNINSVQLSPTVQATFSNYTRAHGGAAPPLVEYFLDPAPERVVFAKLQSEDGGRFLFKSNRNMIVLADEAVSAPPDRFIWLTLRQISALLRRDNIINACARSVLAALL